MTRVGPIAIVSALDEELIALAERLEGAERRRIGELELRFGKLAGRETCLAVSGEGRAAGAAVERLLAEIEPAALLGVGVAGGLSGDLRAGDVVRSERVLGSERGTLEPARWLWSDRARRIAGLRGATVVSVREIAASAAAKRDLAAGLGPGERAVVDLESAAWAGAAVERGLPWLVLRAVSDTLEENLPLDFDRFRTSEGGVSRLRVLLHALPRPKLLIELARLRRRVDDCAVRLANTAEALLAW